MWFKANVLLIKKTINWSVLQIGWLVSMRVEYCSQIGFDSSILHPPLLHPCQDTIFP